MIERMTVSVRVPAALVHQAEALKVVARAGNGAFGVLPNHADFTTALTPSVLILTDADGTEKVFGIDEGVLVKHGAQVDICVRRAIAGDDLEDLRKTVRERFVDADEQERDARAAISRLEANIVRRFAELKGLR